LRRSLSRFNNFNTGFIDKLLQSDSDVSPVRVRIEDSYIGYTPSYIDNVEFEFWFGPSYSDDIMSIPEGLTTYVPDLLEWLNSFSMIPVDREGIRKWFEIQVKFIHSHGKDGVSPINSTLIQSDGTFFQKRRNIQQDVDLKDVKMEGGGFMAEMSYLPGKEKLAPFIDSGKISFTPMMVINHLKCAKTGTDYLTSPFIAPFGETTCSVEAIESMVFVWCGNVK
jgi:hypothetical protein